MFPTLDALRAAIHTHGLDRLEEAIVRAARPSIRMIPTPTPDDDLPIGASKLIIFSR